MKNLLTILPAFLFLTNASFATVRTVSNHPLGGAQYPGLQQAYDAANTGDTLLIEGTDIVYNMSCAQPWNKLLTVIGIGFNPNKQIPKRTKIRETDCWSEFRVYPGASGSSFYGIEFTGYVWTANQSVNNLVFEDCKFNAHYNCGCAPASNIAFRNCIFDADNQGNILLGQCGTSVTGIISNCVFDGYIEGYGSALANVIIDHCVFLTPGGSFNNLYYAQIRNCIFMNGAVITPTGSYYCNYENNICRVAASFPPYPGNGNTGSNNIEATDPLFVSCSPGALYSPAQDYHLQAGSAAIGAGNDMTDLGVHGGFLGFSEQGESLINPIIRSMNIINTSVASNGTLNVQLHATKPDNN